MAVEIKYNENSDEVKRAIATDLTALLQPASVPTLLLLSGGSALALLSYLQLSSNSSDFSSLLTIGMIDERFDKTESNFVHLRNDYREFYERMIEKNVNFLDTNPRLKDQYEMADWYNSEIKKQIAKIKNEKGNIISVLGMGADGHIAGILPYSDQDQEKFYDTFLDTDRLVVGYDAAGKNHFAKRFTLTFPALLQATHVFSFISGPEKTAALRHALRDNPPLHSCPAYYFQVTEQKVTIYTSINL